MGTKRYIFERVKSVLNEAKKMKGKDPCWTGYQMVGKKKKNGRTVPNCVLKEARAIHFYHPEKETPPYKNKIPAFHEFSTDKHLITITEPSSWSLMDIHVYDKKRKETLYSAGYKNGHDKPWGLWSNKATMVDDFKKHKVPKHEIKSIFKQIKKHVEKHIGGTISDDPLHHDIWDNDGNM